MVRCLLSFCRLQHVIADPAGEASPWSFHHLCRAAGAAKAAADAASANTMLSNLSSDDYALLAAYLVRTKRAVREDGVLKVLVGGGGGGSSGKGTAVISETDKDLLRLRCTGEGCVTYIWTMRSEEPRVGGVCGGFLVLATTFRSEGSGVGRRYKTRLFLPCFASLIQLEIWRSTPNGHTPWHLSFLLFCRPTLPNWFPRNSRPTCGVIV